MATLDDEITVETGLFEHREVKPHFINDCCFGEDFAAWLRPQLSGLAADGFAVGESIQEDYGWGFWVRRGREGFWVAFSCVCDGPEDGPAQWVVSVSYDAGLNLIQRLFHKADPAAFSAVRDRIFEILKSADGIRVIAD